MTAHVTDCAWGMSAVTTRSPLSSRWTSNVAIGLMLSTRRGDPVRERSRSPRRAVLEPVDEAHRLPTAVDGGALVVDEPRVQARPLDGVEVEVGLDLRRLLRPRDPERVVRVERVLQRGEAALELRAAGREQD